MLDQFAELLRFIGRLPAAWEDYAQSPFFVQYVKFDFDEKAAK